MEEKGRDEEMDSLFEGMVLFDPSQLAAEEHPNKEEEDEEEREEEEEEEEEEDEEHHDHHGPPIPIDAPSTASKSSSPYTNSFSSSQPLDENLFSDLTIITPLEPLSQSQSQSRSHPSPTSFSSSAAVDASIPATASSAREISLSRQISRKKKRGGLRIGYARDAPSLPLPDSVDDHVQTPSGSAAQDNLVSEDVKTSKHDDQILQPQQQQEEQEEEEEGVFAVDDQKPSPSSDLNFDYVTAQITEKLNRARELVASASAARKESIRRKRKASENVNLASSKYRQLEKELEEACEAEDFERAERVSESLAAAESEKRTYLIALRDAEADSDAIESKMHEALQAQIATEEQCVSLLDHFAKEAANNADLVLETAQVSSSKGMDKWLSSTEDLEIRKMELEIESQIINDARQVVNNSIEDLIEGDRREKELLCRKKEILTDELEKLLELVKQKEKEIAENDSNIEAVEERIVNVVSGFQEMQANVDAKYDNLRTRLSQMDLESEALSMRKEEIDEHITREEEKGARLRELSRVSAEEAKAYQEAVGLRKSLMSSILSSMENKLRLVKTEEKLSEDVQMLQQEVSSARASLQELSSRKTNIQQDITSFKQRIIFIDKRVPELEAEKKVAAAARNFKEAARIAAEAKSSSVERERIQIDMERAESELEKLEEGIKDTVNRLQETENLILSKEKEVAMARFQSLLLIAGAATAEKDAAMELGDLEEANLLLAEAEAADSEAKQLQQVYNFKLEDFENLPKHFIPIELVSNLGREQLARLAKVVSPSVPLGSEGT